MPRFNRSGFPFRSRKKASASLGRSKYKNVRTEVDGIKFDSKREAKRYGILKALQEDGQISDLKLQVPYRLHAAGGKFVGKYVADFTYIEKGELVTEDSKGGVLTDLYKWKRRHMKAEYGIVIRET